MKDLLAEFADKSSRLRDEYGVDQGFMVAYAKELGLVPEEAQFVALVFSASTSGCWWKEDEGDEWEAA